MSQTEATGSAWKKLILDLAKARLITGGFGNFKGISVELVNESLKELLEAVCCRLKARGLAFACVPDEDVIFYLPLARRAKVGIKQEKG